MSNHWHFVVRPASDPQVTDFFRWLTHTHAMRWRVAHHVGHGPLYQRRFKSFPVQNDQHLLTLCRYVERNALAAKLVTRAEQWPWSSLRTRDHGTPEMRGLLSEWTVKRPSIWLQPLNRSLTKKERLALQLSLKRGRPYGNKPWVREIAAKLEMKHTLRSEGRPRNSEEAENENN